MGNGLDDDGIWGLVHQQQKQGKAWEAKQKQKI